MELEITNVTGAHDIPELVGIAKAQALRDAFPECCNACTAEEIEGKEINMGAAVTNPVDGAYRTFQGIADAFAGQWG